MMAQLTYDELTNLVPDVADTAFDELDAQSPRLDRANLDQAMTFDREQSLPNLNLAYVDKASMAASVEVRVPLLDEMVVEATLTSNSETFISNGTTKVPLRQAARGIVCEAVIDRQKSGFGGPVRAWFQGTPGIQLGERIVAAAEAGLFNRQAAIRIHRAASHGRQDTALAAWALVCLHSWHQEHS
jgi:asparagine synthase (glutamine-hydrolysing)